MLSIRENNSCYIVPIESASHLAFRSQQPNAPRATSHYSHATQREVVHHDLVTKPAVLQLNKTNSHPSRVHLVYKSRWRRWRSTARREAFVQERKHKTRQRTTTWAKCLNSSSEETVNVPLHSVAWYLDKEQSIHFLAPQRFSKCYRRKRSNDGNQ
jgi:hypothetical protein